VLELSLACKRKGALPQWRHLLRREVIGSDEISVKKEKLYNDLLGALDEDTESANRIFVSLGPGPSTPRLIKRGRWPDGKMWEIYEVRDNWPIE
jgi:hypothetical protein